MKFRDLFVPRWQHSDPDVRINRINKLKDEYILKIIIERDEDQLVRNAARDRLAQLPGQVRMTEKGEV